MIYLFFIIEFFVINILALLFGKLSIAIIGLLMLFLVFSIVYRLKDRTVLIIQFFSFFVLLLFMLILYFGYIEIYNYPYYNGGSDDYLYEAYALQGIDKGYYSLLDYRTDPNFGSNVGIGFIWILSILIRFTNLIDGYSTLIFRLINIFIYQIIGLLIYQISYKIYVDEKKSQFVFIVFLSLMNGIFISSHVFRDTLNSLLFVLLFGLSVNKRSLRNWLFIAITVICLCILRLQNIYFILCIYFIYNFIKHSQKLDVRLFIIIIIALFIASKSNFFSEVDLFLNRYTEINALSSDGFTKKIFAVPLIPFGIILRGAYAVVYPNILGLLNLKNIFYNITYFINFMVSTSAIFQLLLIPKIFHHKKKDIGIVFLLVLFFGIVSTTFTFRHFISIYPFFLINIVPKINIKGIPEKICYVLITFLNIILLFGCIRFL